MEMQKKRCPASANQTSRLVYASGSAIGLILLCLCALILYGCSPDSSADVSPADTSAAEIGFRFLASYEASVYGATSFGETLAGTRTDLYFRGDLTGECVSGEMTGIDYFLERSDGIAEINAYATIDTGDAIDKDYQGKIRVHITGYIYPDGSIKDSYVRYTTGDSRYEFLNDRVITGQGRMTSESTFEVDYFWIPSDPSDPCTAP